MTTLRDDDSDGALGASARLGLGLAALGRPAYLNVGHEADLSGRTDRAVLERHAHAMLDAALGHGIGYFDAARSYGLAEHFLGRWLASAMPPDAPQLTVASKWGYEYVAAWSVDAEVHEVKDHSLATFRRQLAETRQHLGDVLSVYQVHSVTPESPALSDPALLAALADLRSEGVTIGLSTSGPEQPTVIRRALDVTVDGARLFGSVQSTWNLLEPSAGPALAEAADAQVSVVVKEALANGRLTSRVPEIAERVLAAVGEADARADAIALAAALRQPWASVVLSGAATPEQLDSNVGARSPSSQVVDAIASAAFDGLAEPPERYWATRSQLPWT